jgi:hypothetical protein
VLISVLRTVNAAPKDVSTADSMAWAEEAPLELAALNAAKAPALSTPELFRPLIFAETAADIPSL